MKLMTWLRKVFGRKLHVFFDGEADWYVARSPRDALELQRKMTGLEAEDQDWTFDPLPDDRKLTICVDDNGQPSDDNSRRVTLSCGEWVKRNGRGFMCSTEY